MTLEDVVIRRRGEGGSRGVLLAGLFLGLVAAILIVIVLSRGDSNGATSNSGRIAVVAREDVPARTRLTRDMLEVRTYEDGDVNLDAFTSANQLVNRVTATDVQAGQPILPSQVSTTAGEGLTFAVRDGMRGVSVSASEVIGAGGNLSPGNYVDVVGVFLVNAGDAGPIVAQLTGKPFGTLNVAQQSTLTFTLLQNLRVLAVAQDIPDDTADPSQEADDSSELSVQSSRSNPRASTVTLEVTQQQAQILSIADLHGDLRLSLRAFGDETESQVTPIVIPEDD